MIIRKKSFKYLRKVFSKVVKKAHPCAFLTDMKVKSSLMATKWEGFSACIRITFGRFFGGVIDLEVMMWSLVH